MNTIDLKGIVKPGQPPAHDAQPHARLRDEAVPRDLMLRRACQNRFNDDPLLRHAANRCPSGD